MMPATDHPFGICEVSSFIPSLRICSVVARRGETERVLSLAAQRAATTGGFGCWETESECELLSQVGSVGRFEGYRCQHAGLGMGTWCDRVQAPTQERKEASMCGRFVPTAAEAEGWAGVVPKDDLRVTCPKSGSTGTGMIETKSIDRIDASVFLHLCGFRGYL